jgi:hypothetical protein
LRSGGCTIEKMVSRLLSASNYQAMLPPFELENTSIVRIYPSSGTGV